MVTIKDLEGNNLEEKAVIAVRVLRHTDQDRVDNINLRIVDKQKNKLLFQKTERSTRRSPLRCRGN